MSQDELNTSKVPDPEVVPRAKRRRFKAEYKVRILEEVDACSEPGEIGALLRREGLYSSHLTTWRRQREQGQLEGLSPKKRGRKPSVDEALAKELAELKRENQRLENRLQQAETIIEVQKKLSGLLGLTLNENQPDEAR
jgi:transposase